MIASLLVAFLAAAPGSTPGAAAPHAAVEAALLRAAYPDHDQPTGWLGHGEGYLVERSSACLEQGPCVLAVAAADRRPGGEPAPEHAWTTFLAFRSVEGAWVEQAHTAGPVIATSGRWLAGVSVQAGPDGALVTVTTSSSGDDGSLAARHLWSWEGKRFLPVLSAPTGRTGATETEASYALCADRPSDRPSWELRTREREGRGKWTETRVRVVWNGQAWVERPADRACNGRSEVVAAVAAATPAGGAGNAGKAAASPAVRVRSASASKTAAAPRAQPRATAPAAAVDGNRQTAWVAGGKKGGVGEWLQLDLAAPTALGALLVQGTCPGPGWKAGHRLKKVRLRFPDGPAQEASLADLQAPQLVTLVRKTPTRWIRVEVLEVYRGASRQEACITELTPRGR